MPQTIRATIDTLGNLTAIETFQGPLGWVQLLAEPIQRGDVPDLVAAIAPQPQPPAASEARRSVEALHLDLLATADTVAALHGAVGTGLRSHCVAAADKLRLTATDARTALLRALGVEA